MSSNPVFSYKTSTIGASQPAPKTGKADTAGTSGTSGAPSAPSTDSSYMDALAAAGYAKTGTPPPAGDSQSGDPVADLLNTLDKINNNGVPQTDIDALKNFLEKFSAMGVLSKLPDSAPDLLDKINSVISTLKKKKSDLLAGIASGTGTPQQVQAAQQYLAVIDEGLPKMQMEADKTASVIPQFDKKWSGELKLFQEIGGTSDPRDFDKDGDGWIGKPNGKTSYRIGTRTFDKAYEDLAAKKLYDAGATAIKYKFKKGETQYWAINPETDSRVQFDPKTKKVVGDQVAAPGYTASMGAGFANDNSANIALNDKGEYELKAKEVSNSQKPFEAGLNLNAPEHIYVEVDTDGEIVKNDQDQMNLAPFEMKDGQFSQPIPDSNGQTKWKQIYVKEMKVSTESKDGTLGGDIIVELRGGDDDAKIMSMRITGPDSNTLASDVALAITSDRETPIILDASSYESTCRTGIKNPANFASQFQYDGSGQATGPQAAQVNDTLKHFVAQGSSGEIDSLLNRGISFQVRGYITGTSDNDVFVVPPPQDFLTIKDDAYTTVIDGQGGHNAVFGQEVGSVFATGMTMASIENVKKQGDISIGINPYGEKKSSTGNIAPLSGNSGQSNKLYIHVKSPQSKVAIQSANDGKLNASTNTGTGDPAADAWDQTNDDFYDVTGNEVATNTLDANNPNQSFDPDLQAKNGRKPIKGKMTSAATGDFQITGQTTKEHLDKLIDSITKKASEKDEDWKIDGTTQEWMKGKYYQADKNTLEQFFSDFSANKVDSMDPFQQLEEGIKQASGGDE